MRRCISTVTLNLTVHAWSLYTVGCLLLLKTLFDMSIIIILFACSVICDVMYIIINFMRKLLVKLYFKARALLTHSRMVCLAIIVYLLRNASLEKSTCDLDAVGIQVGQTYACTISHNKIGIIIHIN